jgi:hypothetical protein
VPLGRKGKVKVKVVKGAGLAKLITVKNHARTCNEHSDFHILSLPHAMAEEATSSEEFHVGSRT